MNVNNMNALTEWHIIYNSFENIGSVYLILSIIIIHGLCVEHIPKNVCSLYVWPCLDVRGNVLAMLNLCCYADMTNCYFHIGVCFLHTSYTHTEFLALILQTDPMLKLIYFFDSFIFHLFTNVFSSSSSSSFNCDIVQMFNYAHLPVTRTARYSPLQCSNMYANN